MSNMWIDNSLDRMAQTGLNWPTAKFRLYAVKKAPWGDSQKLTSALVNTSTPSGGFVSQQYKTVAANGLNASSVVTLSEIKTNAHQTGWEILEALPRRYVANTAYVVGDLLHPTGGANWDWILRCVKAGQFNGTPLWPHASGQYAGIGAAAGPVFQNIGQKAGTWPMVYPHKFSCNYVLASGEAYGTGNTAFAISNYDTINRYPGISRDPTDYGIVYNLKNKYLSEWTPDTSIFGMSEPLTNKVIRPNGVLDANDTEIDIGINTSNNMFLLLVRTAHNDEDEDLPKSQQEVVAFWDYGRYIGSVYATDVFTGNALVLVTNLLQLASPLASADITAIEV